MDAPHAPWSLQGECLVGLARHRGPRAALPEGLQAIPGPCLVMANRFTDSPVGPYLELVVAEPARLGARPGICVVTMVVDSPDSRIGGRINWGFPKELGTLRWSAEGDRRELRWEERGIVVSASPIGPAMPMLVPFPALQRRSDGPVFIPCRMRGRARLAKLQVEAPPGDPLAGVAGSHPGAAISGVHLVVD